MTGQTTQTGRDQHRKLVKHYNIAGDAHFLTFSCYRRIPLLSKDRTRLWFLDVLAESRNKHQFDLWAWVIMPEHVHLLIYPRLVQYDMDDILASIKQPVGTKAIRFLRANRSPLLARLTVKHRNREYRHFWQVGPGWDQNLYRIATIYRAIEYIHNNPVRRGLVKTATDWLWSSARDWAGLDSPFIQVDRTLPPLHPYDGFRLPFPT